jgi:hypothetical protein
MYREALFGIVAAAILFVPVFVAIVVAVTRGEQIRAARERRIAQHRKSPESQLLRLNDRVRS